MSTAWIEALLEDAEDHRRRTGRPLVTLSYAQSLDGSLAARRGQPLALSGDEAMRLTHSLRAAHQALLVGSGTMQADDPRLTVRQVEGRQPQPVVLDSHLRTPLTAALFKHPNLPWIATRLDCHPKRANRLEAAGARLLRMPLDSRGMIDLLALLECLAACGIASLMVEGGGRVLGSFYDQGLADQVVLTIAPLIVGGYPVQLEKPLSSPFRRLHPMNIQQLGEDLIVWGKLT